MFNECIIRIRHNLNGISVQDLYLNTAVCSRSLLLQIREIKYNFMILKEFVSVSKNYNNMCLIFI